MRANGVTDQHIADIIELHRSGKWEGGRSVGDLAEKWKLDRQTVYGLHGRACQIMAADRGDMKKAREDMIESFREIARQAMVGYNNGKVDIRDFRAAVRCMENISRLSGADYVAAEESKAEEPKEDLSNLTPEQLRQRFLELTQKLEEHGQVQ